MEINKINEIAEDLEDIKDISIQDRLEIAYRILERIPVTDKSLQSRHVDILNSIQEFIVYSQLPSA